MANCSLCDQVFPLTFNFDLCTSKEHVNHWVQVCIPFFNSISKLFKMATKKENRVLINFSKRSKSTHLDTFFSNLKFCLVSEFHY